MAPIFSTKIIIISSILALCFTGISSPAAAASPVEIGLAPPNLTGISQQPVHDIANANLAQTGIKEMVFKFYFDPALVPNMDFAKAVLPKYIEDMNSVLAKNTNRRLVFNPETDIILTVTQPHSNQAVPPMPVEDFEIWAYAVPSTYSVSYGGYAGIDDSGAGVLAGLKWTKIYDPGQVVTLVELTDYWTQINNMLHELAHVFGAGIGEYYKLSSIKDTTGISPLLDINVLDPDDLYWADKPDFMADPLLRNAVRTEGLEWLSTREALLAFVQYSNLTATIMNGDYRNGTSMIDLQHVTVRAVTGDGAPIADANVKIWSVVGDASYQTQLLVDGFTDSNGQVSFAWGGSAMPHNSYDFLRLIKVYKDGYIASAKYISIFDADIVRLIDENDLMNIPITLSEQGALSIPTTLVNSILPTSRTASVSNTVTIFNTVINAGVSTAADLTLSVNPTPAGIFTYQQTDCATNTIIGSPNPSLDLAPGGVLCYVLSFTPNATFAATSVHIQAQASNASSTNLLTGINTWLLRSTAVAGPDIIALTTTTDFHQVSCSGVNAFAVALSNVGAVATGDITAVSNTGSATLPLSISISETDPATGVVIGDNVLQNVGGGENRTVAVFVTFNGCVTFDPAANRIFIEFRDASNNVVGSTSTAASTNR